MREEGDRSRDEGGEGARAEPGRGAALVFESKKVSMDVFISLSEDVNAASFQKHLGRQAMLKPVVSLS